MKDAAPQHDLAATLSRRTLLRTAASAALLAGAARLSVSSRASAAPTTGGARKLVKNATVVTGTGRSDLGNRRADVLIEGTRIAEIGVNLSAPDAVLIDAGEMIAIPGFIDSHRHLWQGCIRQVYPNDALSDYFGHVLGGLGPRYRPEDVHVGNLVSALSALDAGVTTVLDYSHISNTPDHSDAAIAALRESGIRAVYGFGPPELGEKSWSEDKSHRYPADLKRLRKQYFNSADQLLTLALAADGPSFGPVEPAIAEWEAAREVQARIAVHIMGPETYPKLQVLQKRGLLNSATTYIHCTNLAPDNWNLIRDTGASVSISSLIEMQMGHGIPAIQQALDHDLRPSLSVDVETTAPNDLFTQMRTLIALQRALVHQREAAGEKSLPRLLEVADVFEFATHAGAVANGLEKVTGVLQVGKQADIVLLRRNRINVLPVADVLGAVVLGMDTGNVDTVLVGGRILKQNGQLVGVDLRALQARAEASQHFLLGSTRGG